jgi:hypothetical protein
MLRNPSMIDKVGFLISVAFLVDSCVILLMPVSGSVDFFCFICMAMPLWWSRQHTGCYCVTLHS